MKITLDIEISWDKIDDKYNFITIDKDGEVALHEEKPNCCASPGNFWGRKDQYREPILSLESDFLRRRYFPSIKLQKSLL